MVYKTLIACLPQLLHLLPLSLRVHLLPLSPVLTPLQPLQPLCCPSSTPSRLLPSGLGTDHSLYLKCSFPLLAWHSPLAPLSFAQMFASCGEPPPPPVNSPVSCTLVYSFSLCHIKMSNISFNSFLHYVYCLLPVFPCWNAGTRRQGFLRVLFARVS